ncbi:MAG TPA: hypothetical protein VGW39_03475 [Chthoniobacterales bacterium]|nr:hypothetical protein [Chthoniobacterales bacterium]
MKKLLALSVTTLSLISIAPARAADALPSWNDTASKKAIVAFVRK